MENNVAELVRRNEQDFISGTTTISKYVDFSLNENINKIDAYLNSKHISGDKDSLGRDKPFFNIVTAAVNIWMRATDIDRRDIKIRASKSGDIFFDFLATHHLREWMRREKFGDFLNDWGRTLARYGSAVTKFIEADGRLHCMVVPWNRLIVDPIDFDNDVVIEVLELTPSQLRKKKGYDKDMVEQLIASNGKRETTDRQTKDNKTGYIKVYEVHGEMPLSWLTDRDEDKDTYTQQIHVVSFTAANKKGEYNDFCLYKGKEKKHPYMIAHLIKEDGRTMGIGAVENLFEAQWMINHTQKQIKDQLDLASKLIFQTNDGNFVGQNALNAIENGDILIYSDGKNPLTQLANNSHDVTSLQNLGTSWKNLAMEVNGISESMMGQTAPSGTAWRQVEAVLNESHSLFEYMKENKGLAIEAMLREYIMPFLKTKMDTTDEIVAVLEAYDIDKIDKKFVPYEATKRLAKKLIKHITETGEVPLVSQDMVDAEERNLKEQLSQQGTQRFFKPSELEDITWKKLLEDFEWEVEVDITGEQANDQADMATLTTVFQTIASNPQILENPKVSVLFNRIIGKTKAISPLELQEIASQEVTPQAQPQVAPMAGLTTPPPQV